jgi:hypothetical protein
MLRITVGGLRFTARFENARAPRTVAAAKSLLPLRTKIIQARWSGEAAWIPLGDLDLGLNAENATGGPQPGQLLLYPGGISETEILVPYGLTQFASRFGPLSGNHFATLQASSLLDELGELVLWQGAQEIIFELEES